MAEHIDTGKFGEDLAVRYLEEEKSYTILDRNYRFQRAELDIVAYDGKQIIVVEVKTRKGTEFGEPETGVDDQKKRQLYKAAGAWLHERKMTGAPIRFDVVAIVLKGKQTERLSHYEGAFWYL